MASSRQSSKLMSANASKLNSGWTPTTKRCESDRKCQLPGRSSLTGQVVTIGCLHCPRFQFSRGKDRDRSALGRMGPGPSSVRDKTAENRSCLLRRIGTAFQGEQQTLHRRLENVLECRTSICWPGASKWDGCLVTNT